MRQIKKEKKNYDPAKIFLRALKRHQLNLNE